MDVRYMNKSHRITPFLFLSQKSLWQLTLDYTPPAPISQLKRLANMDIPVAALFGIGR